MAERMLEKLGLETSELSILLTDDAGIRKLNLAFRHVNSATDVLAFPLDGKRGALQGAPRLLGDVAISLDTAARQARSRRRKLVEEVRLLLAHGILHLIGYDHRTASQKQRMRSMTRRLIRAAGGPRSPARRSETRRKRPRAR